MTIDERILALKWSLELMAQTRRNAESSTDQRLAQTAQAFEATRDSIMRLERKAVLRDRG